MREFLERIKNLPAERVKLLAAQLQARVDALESQRVEPIAIVGMSCRFPGGANSPEIVLGIATKWRGCHFRGAIGTLADR